ncbi:hypothetical protein EV360DRAFT_67615 [Lentinula raphanica]|nr:hypothetical protein EV360DRAFT_67615 [Lentinula raphanica]
MTTYSAFFSSGLLAPPHLYPSMYNNSNLDVEDHASDMELDRSMTPTSTNMDGSMSSVQQPQPRLRRRRSSLTIGASPLNTIKSPSRAAGTALQLQRHLYNTPSRSRSGSVSSVMGNGEDISSNIASEKTSLYRRMRSGSVGSVLKSKRGTRRGVPGPSFPPPSAPLPALPPIPGTPNRSKAFSLAVPTIATRDLARKLAAGEDVLPSPSRQPLGEIQVPSYESGQPIMKD